MVMGSGTTMKIIGIALVVLGIGLEHINRVRSCNQASTDYDLK